MRWPFSLQCLPNTGPDRSTQGTVMTEQLRQDPSECNVKRLLTGAYESQKILGSYHTDPTRMQIETQATIQSISIN